MREVQLIRLIQTPTVLIVEDESRMRDLLIEVLPDMGYQPFGTQTAEEGLSVLLRQSADIVILDLNLPVMDGMTFLDRFRKRCKQTPVIIMTGFGDLPSAQSAIRHRVIDFLTKPCHLGEIEGALGRARRQLDRTGKSDTTAMKPDKAPAQSNHTDQDGSILIPVPTTMTKAKRLLIDDALQRHNGNRSTAAAELGISRRTLYKWLGTSSGPARL